MVLLMSFDSVRLFRRAPLDKGHWEVESFTEFPHGKGGW